MDRQQIFACAKSRYGTEPEYLWAGYPTYAVLRHAGSGRWYAVIMDVPRNRLGLDGPEAAEILNVKCEPGTVDFLRQFPGFLPAYHMNKTHWISILLGGPAGDESILELLDKSYRMTAGKQQGKAPDAEDVPRVKPPDR